MLYFPAYSLEGQSSAFWLTQVFDISIDSLRAYILNPTTIVTPHLGCRPGAATIVWLGAFATPFNTFLFLVRADAVFKQNKTWRFILIILWLSTFTSLTTPFSVAPYPFELNGYCVVGKVDRMGAAGAIAVAIFDTAVFVSMTYKILSISKMGDRSNWGRMFFGGTGQVSRTLLLTGQLYYL